MSEPIWIPDGLAEIIHDQQIAIHGGLPGVRDSALLDSALAYSKNLAAYEDVSSLPRLAAAYASRVAKNHAFVDGNKRTAWVLCYTFLGLNGIDVNLPEAEVVHMVNGLAEGSVSEEVFSHWLESGTSAIQA